MSSVDFKGMRKDPSGPRAPKSGACAMDPRVLVVAQEMGLRAKIALVLRSAGYTVELAENRKRALEVAAREQIDAAIIVRNPILAGLEGELHDKVPRTIALGQE